MNNPLPRLGVLFSGGGRTVENLAQNIVEGSLQAEIAVAISSHAGAGGVERAAKYGVRTEVLDYREHGSELSARINEVLEEEKVDWVLLAGFIRYYEVPGSYRNKVLNIHPSLLPDFGGKGFYGMKVHQAVIEAGAELSGCTVHLVNDEYDEGPIIVQRAIALEPGETPESLASRVFEQECLAYPEAVMICLSGQLQIEGNRILLPTDENDQGESTASRS
ncbi:MAG: phosphoribosylglycinamide formyltransferase [Planctomycetota bacterium]|nr:phosphoribosylglycinamide formyltransferase [Planctomycetota bacterium]